MTLRGIFCSVKYVAPLWQEKQLEVLLGQTHYKDFPPLGGPVIARTRYTVVPMKEGKKASKWALCRYI